MHLILYAIIGIVLMNMYINFSRKKGTSYTYNEFFLYNVAAMLIWPVMIIAVAISQYGDKVFIEGENKNDRKEK